MLPLGQGVSFKEIEKPSRVADVAMTVLRSEIDRRFLRPLRFVNTYLRS